LIYRWMLAYFLWMARLSPRARWGIVLGGYFGYRILSSVARDQPALAPWIRPLLIAYVVFVLLTWFAMPLFNLLLRLNRFGRHALSRDQRTAANWFALCGVLLAACLATWLAVGAEVAIVAALVVVGLALPLVSIYHCDRGWPRRNMALYTAAMAVVGLLVIVGVWRELDWALQMFNVFAVGFLATQFLANYLTSATARR
jgi:hypothetical protein